MNNIRYLAVGFLSFFLITSCSESEPDEPEVKPDIVYSITLENDSVGLTSGRISCVDFHISPADNLIGLNTDSGDYTIELRLTTEDRMSENYRLTRVDLIADENNLPILGYYRAFIEDLNQRNNYDDEVQLVLRKKNGGQTFLSSTFNVRYLCDSITKKLLDTGLPLIQIETINHEEPTCEYVTHPTGCWGGGIKNATKIPGRVTIMKDSCIVYNSGEYEKGNSGMTIKIRGNTSAYGDKKPYKIKLQKKADLLQRGDEMKYKDKNWLLLRDENLYKKIGFKVNELVGLQWTPAYEYVNVTLNGDYRGTYMLVEAVSRNNECRLSVDDSGYIFEYDAYWWNEDVYVKSPNLTWPMNYTFKYPDSDDIKEEELLYFANMITAVENSLKDGTYPDYIDVNSFASWMLGHDILGNWDGGGSNYYLTKRDSTANSKIMMANLWDFDGIYMRKNAWDEAHGMFYFHSLFSNQNRAFVNAYKAKWEELSPVLVEEMTTYLNQFANSEEAKALDQSRQLDNERWGESRNTIYEYMETAKEWFQTRKAWLASTIPGI